jgi:hypothetical protein
VKKQFEKITKKLVKSILENDGIAKLWSPLAPKFYKNVFETSCAPLQPTFLNTCLKKNIKKISVLRSLFILEIDKNDDYLLKVTGGPGR